jgi:lysophospholipase L1-like esterase
VFGAGFNALGGSLLLSQTIGDKFTFTPTASVDSFDFYYNTNTGQGSLTLDINGGSATTINESATIAMHVATKTGTLGTNTLNITHSAGSNVIFTGIVAYNSAVKEVSVINAGFGTATAATFSDATYPFSPLNALSFLAPDLTIIDLTINDAVTPTALSTYQANLQAIITAAKVSGDVILLGGVPSISTYAAIANQTAINNMAAAVAAKNSVNFISMIDLWGSEAAIAAVGWSYDGVHLTGAGYVAQAALIAPYLQ